MNHARTRKQSDLMRQIEEQCGMRGPEKPEPEPEPKRKDMSEAWKKRITRELHQTFLYRNLSSGYTREAGG